MFEGGLELAKRAYGEGLYRPGSGEEGQDDFRFFFNYIEMSHKELGEINEEMERGRRGEHGRDADTDGGKEAGTVDELDGWLCVEVDDPGVVVGEEWARGQCWGMLRNAARARLVEAREASSCPRRGQAGKAFSRVKRCACAFCFCFLPALPPALAPAFGCCCCCCARITASTTSSFSTSCTEHVE